MSHPPPHYSNEQHSRSSPIQRQRSVYWLDSVSRLLLGFGLTAIALAWVVPRPDSSSPPSQPSAEEPSGFSKFDIQDPIQDLADTLGQVTGTKPETGSVADATVCVQGIMPDGTEVCASGVSIDPALAGVEADRGSVVVTNFHVVANTGDRPPVQLKGEGEVYNAQVIRHSPEMDLALLLVPGLEKPFPIAQLAETSPPEQVAVRAIGFPNNQALTIKDSTLLGQIQECLAIPPCLAIRQGTITHGNSGGPLEFDEQVIGINQGETIQEIAIPVEQVRQFLAGQIPDYGNSADPFGAGGYPVNPYPGGYPPPPRGAMPFPPPMGGNPPRWR